MTLDVQDGTGVPSANRDGVSLNRFQRAVQMIPALLKRDALVILFFALAAIIMTYPLVTKLDRNIVGQFDILSSLWQRWWLEQAVAKGYNPNFSHVLFHPVGLDVTFQPRRWTALL